MQTHSLTGDVPAACVRMRWKAELIGGKKKKKGGLRNDWNIASMMHYLAASPMVQLFIIRQGHSTVELQESRQY